MLVMPLPVWMVNPSPPAVKFSASIRPGTVTATDDGIWTVTLPAGAVMGYLVPSQA